LALIGRILVVLFAYLVACFAAATVLVIGLLLPSANAHEASLAFRQIFGMAADAAGDPQQVLVLTIMLAAIVLAGTFLVPAMLLIAIAEGFRLRSVLLYGGLGGAAGLAAIQWLDLGSSAAGSSGILPRSIEIAAAAGIVAGFVYWGIAGRAAGAWRAAPSLAAGKQ
jgi:hypothetical protein